jgi:amino acid adenylation domain-containing protein
MNPATSSATALPLSFSQESLWFLDRLAPGLPAYNGVHLFRLAGKVDLPLLERSLNELARRQENLHAVFHVVDGVPQVEIREQLLYTIPLVDFSSQEPARGLELAIERAQQEPHLPFDLETGPMLRLTLIKLAEDEHLLLLSAHHIIFDAWSRRIFIKELCTIYQQLGKGQPVQLPGLTRQYPAYASQQRQWWQGEQAQGMLTWWQEKLAGRAFILDLPGSRARPALQTYNAGETSLVLPAQIYNDMRSFCKQERVSLFMLLLAAYQALLQRYSQQEEVIVGAPFANRLDRESEALVGLFVNTLPLPARFTPGMSFKELLHQVREAVLEVSSRQACPFEKIVEAVKPGRDLGRTPIYQVTFNLRNVPPLPVIFNGQTVTELYFPAGVTAFDLELEAREENETLVFVLRFNRDLFSADSIERKLAHLARLLELAITQSEVSLSHLDLLEAGERNQVLVTWNQTARNFTPPPGLPAGFEQTCAHYPSQTAIIHGEETITYQELNRRTNQLAHHLKTGGVCMGTKVGLHLPRSILQMVGLLGILKAGGAYVPLDPGYPAERLSFMVRDSGMSVILTTKALAPSLPELPGCKMVCLDADWHLVADQPESNPTTQDLSNHAAYVIYTSGTTGQPKGSEILHRNVLNFALDYIERFHIEPNDRILQFATINFDYSVQEIFAAFLGGATLVLRPEDMIDSMPRFLVCCEQYRITVFAVTTAYWNELAAYLVAEKAPLPGGLRLVEFGGEQANPSLVAAWVDHVGSQVRLVNDYGPAETTVIATRQELQPPADSWQGRREIPIGKPIANVQVYILDERLQPIPVGMAGEICIGGAGVGGGYLNLPAETAEKFIPDPFSNQPGARLYRTGDLGYFQDDGSIVLVGRRDQQIKLHGFRIEPGEVEKNLLQYPDVAGTVVLLRTSPGVGKLLAACFVPHPGTSPSPLELREFLRRKLPEFSIPSAFIRLTSLPLKPNGKVAYDLLPQPDATSFPGGSDYQPSRTPLEEKLVQAWSQVLGIERIGVEDNFFDLGGHSLLAVRLSARIKDITGRELPLQSLFRSPTIASLARSLESEGDKEFPGLVVPMRPGRDLPPLFLIPAGARTIMSLNDMVNHLDTERPVYGLEYPGMEGESETPEQVEQFARHMLQELRRFQPHGPYLIGGKCFGGLLAFEMARQLAAEGEPPVLVLVIDSHPPSFDPAQTPERQGYTRHPSIWKRIRRKVRKMFKLLSKRLDADVHARVFKTVRRARLRYNPQAYQGDLIVIRSEEREERLGQRWSAFARSVQYYSIPDTSHDDMRTSGGKIATAALVSRILRDMGG